MASTKAVVKPREAAGYTGGDTTPPPEPEFQVSTQQQVNGELTTPTATTATSAKSADSAATKVIQMQSSKSVLKILKRKSGARRKMLTKQVCKVYQEDIWHFWPWPS